MDIAKFLPFLMGNGNKEELLMKLVKEMAFKEERKEERREEHKEHEKHEEHREHEHREERQEHRGERRDERIDEKRDERLNERRDEKREDYRYPPYPPFIYKEPFPFEVTDKIRGFKNYREFR